MSRDLIDAYFRKIDLLRKTARTDNEQTIRPAFRTLLDQWSGRLNMIFTEEVRFDTRQKTKVYPDGTIFHSIGMPFGWWEAKDPKDDLDAEIREKFRKGYPRENIIFENAMKAALYQNGEWVMDCAMTDGDELLRLLGLFFAYQPKAVEDFRKAVAKFAIDLPHVLDALRQRIDRAYADNAGFKAEAAKFLTHVKDTVNPTLGESDVREMLIQHVLTEDIFTQVFNDSQFHRENNIAKELYKLEAAFLRGPEKRELLAALEPYFASIRAEAARMTDHHEKQTFLKLVYENFYKFYNKKAADRLGVVYTPNEIVRFMIEGADWLTRKHFGRSLIDRDVEILDPAAGTGTFVCELIEHFRGQPEKLRHKYKHELHANEVAILPYYVANLNIEATYAAVSGQYAEFENLCFVDTLDNVAGLGIKAGHQHELFGALSDENIERVKRQNRKKISVVIGNPPYNANQQNENENNKNREYKRIDELIKSSYIRRSTAQKTKLYDMYARFFRWASDRLHDDGVLAFVTNNSFIDARTFDGFRRCVAEEFHEVYVIDLKGNARNSGERRRREGGNVFDDKIKVGIAISFWVKKRKAKGSTIRYEAVRDYAKSAEKREFVAFKPLSERTLRIVEPDKNANWINLTENDWDDLIQVADKKTKAAKTKGQERAIFKLFSLGVVTNRDEWVYDFSKTSLREKVDALIDGYSRTSPEDQIPVIKWTRLLKRLKSGKRSLYFAQTNVVTSAYRPFVATNLYYSSDINEFQYQTPLIWPKPEDENRTIVTVVEPRAGFAALAVDKVANKDFFMPSAGQIFPRYRYSPSGERIDNITDWALKRFREAYGKGAAAVQSISPLEGEMGGNPEGGEDGAKAPPSALPGISPTRGEIGSSRKARAITKDDIFAYVYGVLHDPVYRETYAINLKREFPRIPFHPDFWAWAGWGETLLALHIGYEQVEPWPVTRTDTPDERARAAGLTPKPVLKSDPDNGVIRIDSETTLSGIPRAAWDYRLGNRSGLDWVLDQYKEKTPKDPTIREKFNTYRFADYKEKVIDLLARVARVSVETVAITEAMKGVKR